MMYVHIFSFRGLTLGVVYLVIGKRSGPGPAGKPADPHLWGGGEVSNDVPVPNGTCEDDAARIASLTLRKPAQTLETDSVG